MIIHVLKSNYYLWLGNVMRKTKIEKEFSHHIMWLQRYYKKSQGNPLNSILLQMLEEKEERQVSIGLMILTVAFTLPGCQP